jgi:Flp pilus assembly protein TadG
MTLLRVFHRDSLASSVIETAAVLPFLLLLLAGVYDFGRAYYAAMEVASAAEAGAQYGLQNITNIAGIQNAAKLDAADVPSLTATATYGCECSDGTSASVSCTRTPTCTYTIVNYVKVTTAATFTSTMRWPGIPRTIPLTAAVTMRAGQ